jgi:hypothetical protein
MQMRARIYRPSKTAMEYEPESPQTIDPLMGWTSSADMRSQLLLEFDSRDEAVAYAESHEIPYQVFEPDLPKSRPKSYSDNFRFDRKEPWTH